MILNVSRSRCIGSCLHACIGKRLVGGWLVDGLMVELQVCFKCYCIQSGFLTRHDWYLIQCMLKDVSFNQNLSFTFYLTVCFKYSCLCTTVVCLIDLSVMSLRISADFATRSIQDWGQHAQMAISTRLYRGLVMRYRKQVFCNN